MKIPFCSILTVLLQNDAQKTLEAAQKAWETKRDQVTKDANNAIANYNAQITALSQKVQTAQTQYNNVRIACDS